VGSSRHSKLLQEGRPFILRRVTGQVDFHPKSVRPVRSPKRRGRQTGFCWFSLRPASLPFLRCPSGAAVQRTPYSQSAAPVFPCVTCPMPKTVLVADDNPTIRKMLCRMFEREENYDMCAEAEDGKQAIELALQHHPDLIILDLSMPVMNGLEAAHELKKLMPKVPIILFTQHAELGSRIGIMNMDVDRIVAKTEALSLMGHVRSLAPAW
jgi:CheY-like chemotaxis protein